MKWLIVLFKSSMLRWWFMISAIYSASSTCPCCGKQVCPVGLGGAAIVGGILAVLVKVGLKLREWLNRLWKIWPCFLCKAFCQKAHLFR